MLDTIIEYIPSPTSLEGPFQMLISSLEYDLNLGRYLIGKIRRGTAKVNDSVVVCTSNIEESSDESTKIIVKGSIRKILVWEGLSFTEVSSASSGEIFAIAGLYSTQIGGTLSASSNTEPLPMIKISDPSESIKFEANKSPLVWKDGKFVTAKVLQQRFEREKEINISLRITKTEYGSGYDVAGRGELQLSI